MPRSSVVLFVRFEPNDVVGAIEGHKHQAFLLGGAGEPVRLFAGHHGEATGAENSILHALHSGGDIPFHDDQLLFRCVIVRRDDAPGGCFHDGGGWSRF
jgi:hypothetical protein